MDGMLRATLVVATLSTIGAWQTRAAVLEVPPLAPIEVAPEMPTFPAIDPGVTGSIGDKAGTPETSIPNDAVGFHLLAGLGPPVVSKCALAGVLSETTSMFASALALIDC